MPGVICYRTPSQDCASLGHLYRSSPYADTAAAPPTRHERQSLQRPSGSSSTPSTLSERFPKLRPNRSSESPLSISLLLSFSPEVVLLILSELPGRDILRCRSVCKLLKQFIDQSAKLQYIAQANARGFEVLNYQNSARLCLARMLSRERNWTTFGSISSTHFVLDDPPRAEDDPDHRTYSIYDSGKLLLCRGRHVVEHVLRASGARSEEYEVLGFESPQCNSADAFQDWLGLGGGEAVHIYCMPEREVTRVLSVPHRGAIDSVQFYGDFVAAIFRPERQCSGVLVWNWKNGKLIGTLLSVHAPALSFTFLDETTLALVRTDRSARSARIDTYTIGAHGAALQSSLALPDAHPTKWYARADIHAGKNLVHSGCERLKDEQGIVAIDMELRIRAPHDPNTNTTDRRLSVILAIHKRSILNPTIVTPPTDSLGKTSASTPWPLWSANNFRMITGVRISPNSPVWGHRIIAMGPELDKISLFDFCPIGVRAASQVWRASGSWGSHTTSGGGVSVRAALAQRARKLVRANELGVPVGWFDSMKPVVDQMPYVVSIRRGITDVQKVMLDGNSIVVLRNNEMPEQPASSKVILFDFSS